MDTSAPLHRDLGAGEPEPIGQLCDAAPWRAARGQDDLDAGFRDRRDGVAHGGREDSMVVEEGPVDVTGEKARPRQALGRRTNNGFDVEAPSEAWRCVPARGPKAASGALRAGPVCGSARRDENGGSGGDLRGQPFGGRDRIPSDAGKASAAGACHHEASAGIAQGRDLQGGAVATARIAVHLTTSAAASMSDLQGARGPDG